MDHIVNHAGFELCEDAAQIGGKVESSFGVDEHATVARLLDWVDRDRSHLPFFAAYLPVAGHHPYDTPKPGPFAEQEEIGRYRNALHYADEAIGELLDGLRRRKLGHKTTVIVCGDHGQAFGQHLGNYGHTLFLYEENVRIPLMISLPGERKAIRSQTVASVIDIGPTLIDLLGLNIPGDYEGQSLLSPRPALALFFTDYSLPLVGLRDGRWKFVDQLDNGRAKLFDLRRDPDEIINLAAELKGRVVAYRTRLRQWCAAQRYRINSKAVPRIRAPAGGLKSAKVDANSF
jgi:arylsulfatase A-like enzyme